MFLQISLSNCRLTTTSVLGTALENMNLSYQKIILNLQTNQLYGSTMKVIHYKQKIQLYEIIMCRVIRLKSYEILAASIEKFTETKILKSIHKLFGFGDPIVKFGVV